MAGLALLDPPLLIMLAMTVNADADGSETERRGVLVHVSASDAADADQLSMTKTVVIAMSCVVAYLGVMAALTVYCLIHMVRARRLRKHSQLHDPDEREYSTIDSQSSCIKTLPSRIRSG